MANDCYTRITINSGKIDEAVSLYNNILQWLDSPTPVAKWWLGNVVYHSGIDAIDRLGNFSTYRCRGSVIYHDIFVSDDNVEISIDTETAWVPMVKMWKAVCEKYLGYDDKGNPNFEIVYSAEEPGCLLYWTNDPALNGLWIIDNGGNYLTDATEGQAEEYLRERLEVNHIDVPSGASLKDMLKLRGDDWELIIEPWEFHEIEECD